MSNLETISEEIHESRKLPLPPREPGVGCESDEEFPTEINLGEHQLLWIIWCFFVQEKGCHTLRGGSCVCSYGLWYGETRYWPDTDLISVPSLRETWREVTFIHFLKCDVIQHIIPGSWLQCLIFVATWLDESKIDWAEYHNYDVTVPNTAKNLLLKLSWSN